MKNKKMSLVNVHNKLSRAEMKYVMAGDETIGDLGNDCKDTCTTTRDCPQDRYCGTGTCGGKEIKSCFKYP
jgi:hypothetical protein